LEYVVIAVFLNYDCFHFVVHDVCIV
jgi:hypothetical protein